MASQTMWGVSSDSITDFLTTLIHFPDLRYNLRYKSFDETREAAFQNQEILIILVSDP